MKSFLALLVISQAAFGQGYLSGQAARLVIGQSTFTAQIDQQPTTSTVLGGVGGIAYANNMLFVVDSNVNGAPPVNNRVLIYTPVSAFPTPTAALSPATAPISPLCPACVGVPTTVLGEPDFVSYAPGITQSTLNAASAVASDGNVLVVADTDNNRVLIWNPIPTTNGQPANVVIGQANFTSGGSVATPSATSLRGPEGVWIWNGKLFIADTINNRILIYNSIPTTNGAAADVVLGQPDFKTYIPAPVTLQAVPATTSNMSSPTSVTTDGTHLFVADLGHNRVMIWNSIPTTNNQPADVEIGQPDFTSDVADNAFTGYPATTAGSVATTGQELPVMCTTPLVNGADANGNPTYPPLCEYTLAFPRFALADNQGRLYVADESNDRVLVYNTIPTTNAVAADEVLGEPDFITDSASSNADSLQSPSALAWDGSNLYVADTFNLRVLVYTPLGSGLPLTSVRNAASLEIYATANITLTGTPAAKDTVTVTIATTTYTYTVLTNDSLSDIADGLVALINGTAAGSTPDPNVIAIADTANPGVILTARVPGTAGEGTALTSTTSTTALSAEASASTITINLADPTQIAPGTLISIFGANFTTATAAANLSQPLPRSLGGITAYVDGLQAPLLFVSPGQINAQMPFEVNNRSSVSVWLVNSQGPTPVATDAVGTVVVPENPGLFAGGGDDPRPGYVYHYSANATGLISIDGSISAGDVATIYICDSTCTIGSIPAGSRTYNYTVQSTDTTQTVRDALVAQMASDPEVTASADTEFGRILLTARVPGTAGQIYFNVNESPTTATIILTAFGPGQLCCQNAAGGLVTLDNPAVPGEVVYTIATGLGITTPATDSITGQPVNGHLNPLLTPVDSILANGDTCNIISAELVPGQIGVYKVLFQLPTTATTDNLTQLTVAQQIHVSNIVTFPLAVP